MQRRPRVFYSVAGLGRGHACRARAIVEELKREVDFFLYCPGESFEYLDPIYAADPAVDVIELSPVLTFGYRKGRVDTLLTARKVAHYLRHFRRTICFLQDEIARLQPALAIVDVEPALPRAARHAGLPLMSIDAHGTFVAGDLSFLPWKLRVYAWFVRLFVRLVCSGQRRMIVSNFAPFNIRRRYADRAVRVGTILREEALNLEPRDEDFIVAYLRETSISPGVLDALEDCGTEVRIYGLDLDRGDTDHLRFKPLGEHFLHDLAACKLALSTAGNQLIGEAFYFGKPVLVLPEPNHIEQQVNAHLLRFTGGGDWMPRDKFNRDTFAGLP